MLHPMPLFEVKSPAEPRYPRDDYKALRGIDAVRGPMSGQHVVIGNSLSATPPAGS